MSSANKHVFAERLLDIIVAFERCVLETMADKSMYNDQVVLYKEQRDDRTINDLLLRITQFMEIKIYMINRARLVETMKIKVMTLMV